MADEQNVVNLAGSQTADVTATGNAGRDVVNQVDPRVLGQVLQFLEGDRNWRDAFSTALERLGERIEFLATRQSALELMQARRNEAEAKEREARREVLDATLDQVTDLVGRVAREQATARRWLSGLTVASVVVATVVALALVWLILRELSPPTDSLAALGRLWMGGLLSLAVQLWRLL